MGWLRARKERRLAERDEYRQVRRLVDEDVTVFGEQLAGLHVETLGDELGAAAQSDYRRALELYDEAKRAFVAEARGLLATALGPLALEGVPKYVRYQADLDRMGDQLGGAGGAGGGGGI